MSRTRVLFVTHRGERHYNDVLLGDDAGQVTNMRDMARTRS